MLSSKRKRMRATGALGPIARVSIIAFTFSAAGCSADVTRFGFSGNNNHTSSIPVPPEPIANRYAPSAPPRGLGLTEAPLPPTSEPPESYRTANRAYDPAPPAPAFADRAPQPPDDYRVVGRRYNNSPPPAARLSDPPARMAAGPAAPFHQPAPDSGGATIDVQQGETLYSIGRRYGVSAAAIKDANGLSSDSVRLGQRLVIPQSAQDRAILAKAPPPAEEREPTRYAPPASPPPAMDRTASLPRTMPAPADTPAVEAPAGWEGRYTTRNGESLYGVALRHKVTLEELKRANGITDPTKVWAGTVLNVPGRSGAAPASTPPTTATHMPQTPPRIINVSPAPDQKLASRTDSTGNAEQPGAELAAGKFRWPVRGKVLAGFGGRPDGTHNDGVNVAVPQGTEIHAADGGKVAYAGNELKGYGNLVLIRHPNGWVTAYAHADKLLVRKDDDVRRGQVIATAGRTGAVDQPQLHFELRQGSRPVDPMPHLVN